MLPGKRIGVKPLDPIRRVNVAADLVAIEARESIRLQSPLTAMLENITHSVCRHGNLIIDFTFRIPQDARIVINAGSAGGEDWIKLAKQIFPDNDYIKAFNQTYLLIVDEKDLDQ